MIVTVDSPLIFLAQLAVSVGQSLERTMPGDQRSVIDLQVSLHDYCKEAHSMIRPAILTVSWTGHLTWGNQTGLRLYLDLRRWYTELSIRTSLVSDQGKVFNTIQAWPRCQQKEAQHQLTRIVLDAVKSTL
jgi:hypothetical protein